MCNFRGGQLREKVAKRLETTEERARGRRAEILSLVNRRTAELRRRLDGEAAYLAGIAKDGTRSPLVDSFLYGFTRRCATTRQTPRLPPG